MRQFADRGIDAPQQFDSGAVEWAVVVFQTGDEFAKRLPLRFLRGISAHALQTHGNLAQNRYGSRNIIPFQYRQQHLLVRCTYLLSLINSIDTFESCERNIAGITCEVSYAVTGADSILTQIIPQLVDKLQHGTL